MKLFKFVPDLLMGVDHIFTAWGRCQRPGRG